MADTGPCLTSTVLDLSSCSKDCSSLCTCRGLCIYHKHGRQLPEVSCSPFTAIRAILSPVTWIKIEDELVNEKQTAVASVLPSTAGTQGLPAAITQAWGLLSLAALQLHRQIEINWCSVQPTLFIHPNSFQIHTISLFLLPSKAEGIYRGIYRVKP